MNQPGHCLSATSPHGPTQVHACIHYIRSTLYCLSAPCWNGRPLLLYWVHACINDTLARHNLVLQYHTESAITTQSLNIILFFSLTLLGQILVIAYEESKGRNDMILVLYSEELFEINPGAKRSTLPTLCSRNPV